MLRIRDYTRGMDQAAFVADSLTSDAVSMNLLAIGESASKLSAAALALTPEIEWRYAINLRIALRMAMRISAYRSSGPLSSWSSIR